MNRGFFQDKLFPHDSRILGVDANEIQIGME